MSSDWENSVLSHVISFNPKEELKKGRTAKKIAMEELNPFDKKINGFTLAEYSGGAKFRNDDTLLARITPCLENGKTAYVDILEKDEIAFGSTEFIVMRAKTGITDEAFIYYLATSPAFRAVAIQSMTGTSGRQRVQNNLLENAVFRIPPLPEQRAIAATLSALDDKIELNNRINKTLEEMAQALFKRWFVDFEFPDENDQPYKSSGGEMEESELGLIPKGWKVGKAEECFNITIGKTPPRKESGWFSTNPHDISWVSISDMGKSGLYVLKTSEYLIKEAVEKHNIRIVPANTVILSFKLTVGRVSITSHALTTNEAIAHFIPKKRDVKEYLYFYLKTFNYESLGNTSSIATAVNSKVIKAIPLLIPSDEAVVAYQNIIGPFFVEILNRLRENHTLSSLRDTLLPKLMSGEIRVPIEEVAADV